MNGYQVQFVNTYKLSKACLLDLRPIDRKQEHRGIRRFVNAYELKRVYMTDRKRKSL